MRFTVIGSGAIGGLLGAHLIRSGHEVLLCDSDPEHVEAIREHGLTVRAPAGEFTVRAPALAPEELPADLGIVLLAVKSHHTAAAVAGFGARLARDSYVLSVQNGLNVATIASAVGAHRVLAGFINTGADLIAPGVIRQGNVATFRVGEPDGPVTERVTEVVAALPWAQATDNISGYLWAKEAYGAMLFATAVSDQSIADALAAPAYRSLFTALAHEVLAQAPVPTEAFDGFDPADVNASIDRLVTFNRASAKTHSGIYRDLAVRHRPTEVDALLTGLRGPLTGYVAALIKAIERGERRCEPANLDLLAAYEAAERTGRAHNAIVALLPAPHRAPDGPLLGLAVAVKDMIDVAGWPRGNGNPADMAGPPRPADAPLVARLRAAGADVFATTTLLEYAAGAPHPELGEARLPTDPGRTAGGSSGGSAALVAGGVCPAALGTDTGGSIRIPAAYCGIVGVKPTHGLLPLAGVEPLAPDCDHAGVLARDVDTARRVLGVLAGHELPAGVPRTVRLGVMAAQLDHPGVTPEVREAVRAALATVAAAGHTLVPVDDAPLAELATLLEPIVLHQAWAHHRDRFTADPGHYGAPTARLLRAAAAVTDERYRAAQARRAELVPVAAALLHGVDALVGPTVAFVAPDTTPHLDDPAGELEGVFTGADNLTGRPAVSLPCPRRPGELPVGLQLAGRAGCDGELLAVAQRVEQALRTAPAPPSARW